MRNHSGGISLAKILIRAGYYWPRMKEKAENYLKNYDECQQYVNQIHQSVDPLHSALVWVKTHL